MNISLGLHPFPWELLFCPRDPLFFHFFATPIANSRPQASSRQPLSHFLSPEFTNPLMARPTKIQKSKKKCPSDPPAFSICVTPYRKSAPESVFQATPNAFERPPKLQTPQWRARAHATKKCSIAPPNCKPPNGTPERMPQHNVESRPQIENPPMARPTACHKIM